MNTSKWHEIRAMLGDGVIKTDSDAGAVLCYNDNFSVQVPNGMGDGTTRVFVKKRGEFDEVMLNFIGVIEGSFTISADDCRKIPLIELIGRYAIFIYDGIVVFEEFE